MPLTGNDTKALKEGDGEPPLSNGKARIYSMRFCPWAERTLLYAAAKGIDVEIVNIDLQNKPKWYFDKHPQGKVPAFEKDGKIVVESGIIPEYLDGIYPESSILPTDPYDKAQQKILLEQLSPLSSSFYGLFFIVKDKLEGEAKDAKIKAVNDALEVAEKALKNKFFGGSSAGYVDWLIYPFIERINLVSSVLSIDLLSSYPNLSKWWTTISSLPSSIQVTQPSSTSIQFFQSYSNGKPNYDIGI